MKIDPWKDMLAGGAKNIPKVIAQVIHELKAIDDNEYLNQVIRLSARQKDLKRSVMNEEVSDSDAQVIQSKIIKALLFTLDEIENDNILSQAQATDFEKSVSTVVTEDSATLTLEELKKATKDTQELLFTLQDEKDMTVDPKSQVILQRQIESTESKLDNLKSEIKGMLS